MRKKLLIGLGAAIVIVLIIVVIARIPADLEIRDWYDLDAVRDNLGGDYLLTNDLDATTAGYEELASPTANEGKGWQPMGTRDPFDPFTGTFDGQGYEISDLFIDRPLEDYVGLFGAVGAGGVIENVGVVNADVTGDRIIGGLVGNNLGTVSRFYSTGNVTSEEWGIGGLVGHNARTGTVIDSYSSGSVTGGQYVGGLVGYNVGIVSNSYSTGNVTGEEYAGGLVAKTSGPVRNSFWDRETSGMEVSGGGTGNTTAEMQDIATFLGAAWNITAVTPGETNPAYIWNIVDGETYSFLSWQTVA